MSTIKLSRRTAEVLLKRAQDVPQLSFAVQNAIAELNSALQRKPLKRSVKLARARKAAKRETKREETARIRREVEARADGRCEICAAGNPTDLHHSFGRVRVRQTASSCLFLCRRCHADLTENRPSAAHWWGLQALVFARLGLTESFARAKRMAAYAEDKAEISGASR